MSLYETGTITGALNSTTISGTGTKWSDAKIGITNGSVLFVSSSAGMDGVYQVKRVINDTSIELTQPIYKAFTNAKYSILVAEASSTASFANQLAATLGYYQAQMDGWQQIMTGTGGIALTAPDGTKVTIKSFTKMSQDIDKKQDKSDILTDLSKSKDVDGVREYLGLNKSLNEKADKSALGTAAAKNAQASNTDSDKNKLLLVGGFGIGGAKTTTEVIEYQQVNSFFGYNATGIMANPYDDGIYRNGAGIQSGYNYNRRGQLFFASNGVVYYRWSNSEAAFDIDTAWTTIYSTRNTTVDSNGFIKKASPIIKIFHDGNFETNDESEGAQVKRESVGVYRISNILGPHSDKAWGGIDGGFEIPKDRNGQRLLWLDYEVDADGSILVKTYHRTYPEAPVFARNTKDGYEESDPIDVPPDQFLSVRVEMPQDSIWNQAQKAAQEAMAQEQSAEE